DALVLDRVVVVGDVVSRGDIVVRVGRRAVVGQDDPVYPEVAHRDRVRVGSRARRGDAAATGHAGGLVLAALGRRVAAPEVGVDVGDHAAAARFVDVPLAGRAVVEDGDIEVAARAGEAIPHHGADVPGDRRIDVLAHPAPVALVVVSEDRLAAVRAHREVDLHAIGGAVRAGGAGGGLAAGIEDRFD